MARPRQISRIVPALIAAAVLIAGCGGDGEDGGSTAEPEDLIGAARAAGRRPAQRSTLYEVLETY